MARDMDRHRHVSSQEQLAEICRQVLANWPEARAAVLFGSRARSRHPSDHRPDSDWDVVVIVDGNQSAEWAAPVREQADNVDAWTIGHEYLEAHASDLGRLPYAVTCDGRLLVGDWTRPIQKKVALRPDDWRERMGKAAILTTDSINKIKEIARAESWADAYVYCTLLLKYSADAAKLLVKAIMERRGVRADYIHSIKGLARTFAKERPEEQKLTQRMKALNGHSHHDHNAIWGGDMIDSDRIRNAIIRLTGMFELWLDELVADPDNGAMKQKIVSLFSFAQSELEEWNKALKQEPVSKAGIVDHRREAVEAVLAARREVTQSVNAFGNKLHQPVPSSPES